jgi:hypothetical protein
VSAAVRETIAEWYNRAIPACDPFIFPESRFRNPWVDDELAEAIQSACRWLDANPCPLESVDQHLHAMLNAYADMKTATVSRVMELREVIELHSKFVDRRALPRNAASESARNSGAQTLHHSARS